MNMYQITFTNSRGYVVNVSMQRAHSEAQAVEIASLYCCNKWRAVRAELIYAS